MDKLKSMFLAIDNYNSRDPNVVMVDGVEISKELIYGRRMSDQLLQYMEAPSDELMIAARGQHIGRWEVPRSNYPLGKVGYYQWRTTLYQYHAELLGDLMVSVGYETEVVERVKLLISKKKLRSDLESQQLEDVICQVFFKDYAVDFASKHKQEKVLDIVQKTLNKMSESGRIFLVEMEEIPGGIMDVIKSV